jgi:MtfA peptidase
LFVVLIAGVALLIVLWLASEPWLIAYRRRRLRTLPFPAEWEGILQQRVPQARRLPAELQRPLRENIRILLDEKRFTGCGGLEVTDEMRVTIAANACQLIFNRRGDYFPGLREILVYPDAFIVDRLHTDSAGIAEPRRQVLAGESWSQGKVILSWADILRDAADAAGLRNVIIHEFAHQLDQEGGRANGAPLQQSGRDAKRWSQVFTDEFARLRLSIGESSPALISAYGATDPAEFFAVVSEVFFCQPQRLSAEHGALYAVLANFYRIDPAAW